MSESEDELPEKYRNEAESMQQEFEALSEQFSEQEKDNAVTTGSSGYSNTSYGGASGSSIDLDRWKSEYMEITKSIGESDIPFSEFDDMLFNAHRNVVGWEPMNDNDLSKAPDMWSGAEQVPDFIKGVIELVIDTHDVIYDSFEDLPPDADLRVKTILKDELNKVGGWAIDTLTDKMSNELRIEETQAEDIARTETSAVLNTSREVAYESSPGSDDYEYYWSGADDSRTTECCKDIKTEIQSRGGAVSIDELKSILKTKAGNYEYGTPDRANEFVPHYKCRHTFVRDVGIEL